MAPKKKTTKRKTKARITLLQILTIIENAYDPDSFLERRFNEIADKNGRISSPSLMGDTLAEFLIREMGDVFSKRAGRRANLDIAAEAVGSAVKQLMDVEAALVRANYGPDKVLTLQHYLSTKKALCPLPPDPEEMNHKRSEAAFRAARSFGKDFGEDIDDFKGKEQLYMLRQNVVDLLADLAHLFDRLGFDYIDMLNQANGHYEEETENEGKQFDFLAITDKSEGN